MKNLNQILLEEKTPMYIFDLRILEDRIKYLRAHLPENIELCYAIKANTFILESISGLVERLEICSPGEYRICSYLNLPSKQFVISGVNKEKGFIEELISSEQPAGCYTAESAAQFEMLRCSAAGNKKRIDILLRLTSGNQFGMDEGEIENIIKKYRDDLYVNLKGLQYFSGTQKTSLKKLSREIKYADAFIEKIKIKYGFDFEEFEFGPGLPAVYFDKAEYDEKAFLKGFSELLGSMGFGGKITLELGRSIAACCGTYFTQVVDTKCNCGENYALVDGGMHQIVYYGQFMAMKKPEIHLIDPRQGECKEWNICGSLCTANDILVKKISLPDLKAGDILAFCDTGAYSMTEGISLFLSRDLPKIILFDGRKYTTVRQRFDTYILNTPKNY